MSTAFRPSLTLAEVQTLLTLAKESCPETHAAIIRKLEVFTLKAKHGITRASHIRAGRITKAAQLGFEDDVSMDSLLEAYQTSPSALSPAQLARVRYHRYTHDMMTPEEEAEYESSTS